MAQPSNHRLRLAPGLIALPAERRIVIASEEFSAIYEEPAHVAVLSEISRGKGTVQHLAELFRTLPEGTIEDAIRWLLAEGVIVYAGDVRGDAAESAFWHALRRAPGKVQVTAHYFGVASMLRKARRFATHGNDPAVPLTLICTDDYLHPDVRSAISHRNATLLARPLGKRALIGPLLIPGEAICWDCLAYWLRIRRWRQASVTNWIEGAYPAAPALSATEATVTASWGMILAAIDRFGSHEDVTDLRQGMFSFDPWTGEVSRIRVLPLAHCSNCRSEVEIPVSARLVAISSPYTGIFETMKVGALPFPQSCFAVASVLSPFPADPSFGLCPPSSASGSGRTPSEAARLLALESSERHSLAFDGLEPVFRGTVASTAAFPLVDCIQISDVQYRKELWDLEQLRDADEIGWVWAQSLLTGHDVPLPAACVYLGYRGANEKKFCQADTNGAAAGFTMDQARLHALLELIERDALAVWWYNQIALPVFPLVTIDSSIRELVQAFAIRGRSVAVFDLSNDLGIPVAAAVSATREGRSIYLGAAAGLSFESAAGRAVREMAQFWFWDEQQSPAATRQAWLREASWQTHPFLEGAGESQRGSVQRSSSCEDFTLLLDILRTKGFDVLAVNCTRPSLGIPVVKLIVPGLRSHRKRFAPGRLYSVPVVMGWRREAIEEARLNHFAPPL
jgi:bacteriocin biosynthesis cyclodehydratase domain-containing protein